jgi:hypothetical protein
MNGREIPGFYYDRERGKYFKIQKSHNAPNPASKHALHNVRQEQKNELEQSDNRTNLSKRQRETVWRYRRDSPLQAKLDREIGLRGTSYYVKKTWPDACAANLSTTPKTFLEPEYSQLRYFDRDPATKTLYVVEGDNTIQRRRINTPDVPLPEADLDLPRSGSFLSEYSFEPWEDLARLTSPISSLNYLPASGALAATTYGSDRPPVVYLSDPDRDGPFINQQFTPKRTSTIWAAAARPTSFMASPNSIAATETENLAVAASSSLILFTRSPTGAWDSTTVLTASSDILTLDWLSPTVVTLGERSGRILLYDTRSRGSSHILSHPGPVVQVRRADDPTRILSAGLRDTLFLYDIRSPYSTDSSNGSEGQNDEVARKRRRKPSRHAARKWSQPVVTYRHHNECNSYLGIAVHPGLGLIATAQDSLYTSTVLRLHNLWTGKTIKNFKDADLPSSKKSSSYCLRFVDDEEIGEVCSSEFSFALRHLYSLTTCTPF